MDLDDNEASLDECVEELRSRDQRESRRARRVGAGARVRERHRLALTARQLVDVEGRGIRARDEDAVRRLRPRDRAARPAAWHLARLLAGRGIDDAHIPARVEDVELGPVLVRRHGHAADRSRQGRDVDGRVDREASLRRDDDATPGHEQGGDPTTDGEGRAWDLEIARCLGHGVLEDLGVCHPQDPRPIDEQCADGPGAPNEATVGTVARSDHDVPICKCEGTGAVGADRECDDIRARQRLATDDAVVPERDDAEGHDLLREMRVRPLVRVALRKQLERRARVVDLVEVHVARVVEPVAAGEQDR